MVTISPSVMSHGMHITALPLALEAKLGLSWTWFNEGKAKPNAEAFKWDKCRGIVKKTMTKATGGTCYEPSLCTAHATHERNSHWSFCP
jgi:hypothetical protein